MFEDSPLLVLPLVSLFLFLATFTVVVVRAYLKRARDYDAIASLPLDDDEGDRS
jgi:hypothetical protein